MRFRLVLPLLALIFPGLANALALGALQVDSKLNQRLKARIELSASSAEELLDLRAALADRSAFERAGLARPEVLSSLRFEVVAEGRNGYIEISSRESIREPQLNFIVEVAAPAGRILREYTVLLRPSAASLDRY